MDLDFIISSGRVFDGSGREATECDIGVAGDRIAAIGDLSATETNKRIDATGCIVCPGFIDAHSHSDTYLLIEPSAASKIYQGITTEICGNCGASAAPLLGHYKMPADWLDKDYSLLGQAGKPTPHSDPCTGQAGKPAPHSAPCVGQAFQPAQPPWKSVADYRTRFAESAPAINAALLVGHNTLHAGICGYEPRGATPAELPKMFQTLEQALDEGAIGLSSGLAYPPGSAVPREELVALCGIVARRGGIYTTHMRSESNGLLEAIDEAIDIADRSGVRLHISHLKASGESNWHKLPAALEKVRASGATADRYPYTAGSTDLDILLPQWVTYGGRAAILERIRDPQTRQKIAAELRRKPSSHWNNVMVGFTQFEAFRGKFLPEIADSLGLDEVDALLHLVDSDELKTGGVFFSLSEKNLWTVLAEPYVSIGSDGSMRAPWGPLASDHPHPRSYGSHTRFLRAALDGQTLALPEAIRKMTALPAEQFGLKKRGLLKKGYFADLAVIDPGTLRENSTYAQPHQLSSGVRHLFVNGVQTLENGRHTPQRGGQFLAS